MTIKVWSWRQAIIKSNLPATTKLVLLVLASYMNDHGSGCYPSISTIAKDTSLTDRAVLTHIKKAMMMGFLTKRKRNLRGQEWASNEYAALIPDNYEVKTSEFQNLRGEPNSSLPESRGESNSGGTELGSCEGRTTFTQGVNDVHTNSPINSPMNKEEAHPQFSKDDKIKNSLTYLAMQESFQKFFDAFPKREGRERAYLVYCKILDMREASPEQLTECAARYAVKMKGEEKFAVQPEKWLVEKRWTDDLPPLPAPAPSLEMNELKLAFNALTNLLICGTCDTEKERRIWKYVKNHGKEELVKMLDTRKDAFGKTKAQKFEEWLQSYQAKLIREGQQYQQNGVY